MLFDNAQFVWGVTDGGGMWFVGGEDDAQHIVDFGGVFRSVDTHFFGDVHDVISCE